MKKITPFVFSSPQDTMARIMAPTVASLRHNIHTPHPALVPCPRDHYHTAGVPVLGGYRLHPTNEPRRWWRTVLKTVLDRIRRPTVLRPLRLFRTRRRRLSPIPVAVRTIEYSDCSGESLSHFGKSRTI